MSKKSLSVFMLAMINVAAIGSVKNWPTMAEYGFASVFYMLLATLIFFLPTALVSAELATGWPKSGGVFAWVKEAFGHRAGFLSIWCLWIENVIWYPTMLGFIAASVSYIFSPSLAESKMFIFFFGVAIFWIATFVNLLGIKTSAWISSVGVVLGTFIPGLFIIALGLAWYFGGSPLHVNFSWEGFIPNMSSVSQLVFFTGIILSFCGLEMSAIHARDVKDPKRDYPRAILVTVLLVLGLSILGVLAISMVIPQNDISLTAGTMQAIAAFVDAYNLRSMLAIMGGLVVIGAIASLSTWIVGPTRGVLAAAESGDLPPRCRTLNKHGMPSYLLFLQAIVVTALSLLFVFMPTASAAYWILTVLVAQVYLVMYLLMFAAAIKLRYKRPDVPRAYRIPGGNLGVWIVSGLGILSSLFALFIGFFPPAQIATGSSTFYVSFLVLGMIFVCIGPSIILWFKKPSWNKKLAHEGKGDD
ncbi:MAG: amino acid permease [Verrucomicrobia bacterium]|nr:amino acid permease [Verrucomicrobiota bacterium]